MDTDRIVSGLMLSVVVLLTPKAVAVIVADVGTATFRVAT
jgi:hypothetical protein